MCLLRLIGVKDLFYTKTKSITIPKWIKEIYVHNKWQNLCSKSVQAITASHLFYTLNLLFPRILPAPVSYLAQYRQPWGPQVTSRGRAWGSSFLLPTDRWGHCLSCSCLRALNLSAACCPWKEGVSLSRVHKVLGQGERAQLVVLWP